MFLKTYSGFNSQNEVKEVHPRMHSIRTKFTHQFAVLIPKNKYREDHLSYIAQTLSDNYNSGIYTLHVTIQHIERSSYEGR